MYAMYIEICALNIEKFVVHFLTVFSVDLRKCYTLVA